MCGRYRLSRRKQIIEEHFDCDPWDNDWSPRYNIAPTQSVPVIRQHPKEPWFFDGKDSKNQTVSNPTIGYGFHTIKYASGKSREFFQIGVSGNKTGISVYILGPKDKKHLAKTYGKKLGKASVTGYCIRFKALKDINIDTLEAAIRYGLAAQQHAHVAARAL